MIRSTGGHTVHNTVYLQNSINPDIVSIIFALGVSLQELQVLGNSRIKYPKVIVSAFEPADGYIWTDECFFRLCLGSSHRTQVILLQLILLPLYVMGREKKT